MERKIRVAGVGQVLLGNCCLVRAGGVVLALHHVDGHYYATEPLCPFHGGPLEQSVLDGQNIICRYEGWQLEGGKRQLAPGVKTYAVTIEGDDIFVTLDR